MTVSNVMQAMLEPGYVQTMVMLSLSLLLPMRHKKEWQLKFVGLSIVFFLLGAVMQVAHNIVTENPVLYGMIERLLLRGAYLLMGLTAAHLLFRVCTKLSFWDSLFGVACVFAIQQMQFCLSRILSNEKLGAIAPHVLAMKWVIVLGVMVLSYWGSSRNLLQDREYGVSRRKAIGTFLAVLTVGALLNYPLRFWLKNGDIIYRLTLIYNLIACQLIVSVLAYQRRCWDLKELQAIREQVHRQHQRQYIWSTEGLHLLHRTGHALRRELEEIAFTTSQGAREKRVQQLKQQEVFCPDLIRTGNQAMDTALVEKELEARERQVGLQSHLELDGLDSLDPVDLYALTSSALEFAIEESCKVERVAMRNVSIASHMKEGEVCIEVGYYFPQGETGWEQPVKLVLDEKQKAALWDMQQIAVRYQGDVTVEQQGFLVTITALLPVRCSLKSHKEYEPDYE